MLPPDDENLQTEECNESEDQQRVVFTIGPASPSSNDSPQDSPDKNPSFGSLDASIGDSFEQNYWDRYGDSSDYHTDPNLRSDPYSPFDNVDCTQADGFTSTPKFGLEIQDSVLETQSDEDDPSERIDAPVMRLVPEST